MTFVYFLIDAFFIIHLMMNNIYRKKESCSDCANAVHWITLA